MILDKLGQEITSGAYIAYGHALGRCAGIRIGKVLKIVQKRHEWRDEDVLQITVQGVDDDWSYRGPELTSRKGILNFPDRIIVLAKSQVPATYLALLEGIE